MFLLVMVSSGFDITVPFISQKLIDKLIEFFKDGGVPPIKMLIFSALGILVATLMSSIMRSLYDYNLFKNVTQIEDDLRRRVFEKYVKLHVLFHHGSSSGQIIGRLERGATAVYAILHDIFGHNLLPPLIVFVGVMTVLLYKNAWIALVVFLPLPVYILSVKRITEKIYEIEKQANDKYEAVTKESYDVAANIFTVKKFFQEEEEAINQSRLLREFREVQYSAERLWSVMGNIQTFISTLSRIGIILVGGFLVVWGKSSIGEFVLYITLHGMAYAPMAQLSHVFPRLRRNTARVERLFTVLDEPVLIVDRPGAKNLTAHKDSVEFKNVSFRYSEKRRWALNNVNATIPAGSTVALVGRSGSGKTTFVNLLLRSFDPEIGSVLIDGNDLRNVTRESLLSQIAVVPQEVDLFSRTIFENIAYGKREVDKEDVIRAAKTALSHDFIVNTEHGYDTLVGERGIKLSGGERQRIGIARAILRDPSILILDEATSHLDTESERLIAKATDALIKDRTTFIVAHRLSTILGADMILVFRGGELEAMGKHEELLKKSPTYQKLYSMQFSK
ncbi:MAG: Lipid A export ATP-binding/permease protein MsbA [Parcubacteria group bacterium GW2011_GWA2_42_14]|nr:MAG: Lipid A export ATP-binding/permease protein MsbA [Parcubacteria group bacterium GW2011_GWA2_42_14]